MKYIIPQWAYEMSKEIIPTEDQEQKVVAQWLDLHKIKYAAIPNGGLRNKIVAAKLVGQGVKRGVPDLLIFDPPPASPKRTGLAIEMKRTKGGTVSDDQKEWLVALEERNWITQVCKGATEAIRLLETLGYGKQSCRTLTGGAS